MLYATLPELLKQIETGKDPVDFKEALLETAQLYFESTTLVGEHVDYWFITRGGSPGEDIGLGHSTQGTNQFGAIKIRLGYAAADKYIAVYDTVGCGA